MYMHVHICTIMYTHAYEYLHRLKSANNLTCSESSSGESPSGSQAFLISPVIRFLAVVRGL